MGAWRSQLTQLWRESRLLRVFVANLLLALFIEVIVLPFFGPLFGLPRLEDNALDLMMRWTSNTDWIQFRPIPAAFTLVDIDDASMEKWGDPPLTPRENILKLTQVAVENGSSAVVVDFDFSRSYSQLSEKYAKTDNDLAQYLGSHRAVPAVLLVRDIPEGRMEKGTACPAPKKSFIDEAKPSPDSVQWGSVRFDADSDYILRRWLLWERVCQDGKPWVLSSLQLATAAAVSGPEATARLRQWLGQFRAETCSACLEESAGLLGWQRALRRLNEPKKKPLDIGKIRLEPDDDEIKRRILFRLPVLEDKKRASYVKVKVGDGNMPVHLLQIVSADDVLQAAQTASLSADLFQGRIVVIGASFSDSGDFYPTPLGEMPGAMVLINAMYSLFEYGQMQKSTEFTFLFVLILGVSWLFTKYRGIWGLVASTGMAVGCLVPMAALLFQKGRWLDFVLPLVGIEIHHVVVQFKETFEIHRRRP